MKNYTISNLAAPEGRVAFQKYWYDLIVEQQSIVLTSLFRLWRTAVRGSSFNISSAGESYRIAHPLGLRMGTRVFMEEVIVRHYFNNVQALVYLGAVLLLIFLALRFAGLLTERVALIGIGIEVVMLLMLFIVLFYAPDDEISAAQQENREEEKKQSTDVGEDVHVIREVLEELEDIGGTYASLGLKLEDLAKSHEAGLRELNERVERIRGLDLLESHAERLETTNELLRRLVDTMQGMNEKVELLLGKELEYLVRRELERRVSGSVGQQMATGQPNAENTFDKS